MHAILPASCVSCPNADLQEKLSHEAVDTFHSCRHILQPSHVRSLRYYKLTEQKCAMHICNHLRRVLKVLTNNVKFHTVNTTCVFLLLYMVPVATCFDLHRHQEATKFTANSPFTMHASYLRPHTSISVRK